MIHERTDKTTHTRKKMEAINAQFIPAGEKTQVIDFNVNDARIAEVREEFREVDAYQDIDGAKAAKKVLTSMRTTLGEAHKEQKSAALSHGRMLDGEKNRLLALIAVIEDPIKKDLADIKNADDIKEKARLAEIENHILRLQSYALDRHDLSLEQITERRSNLAKEALEEDRYQEQLGNAKMVAEEADTKLRIVEIREREAIVARVEQDKVAIEQALRTAELDERQAIMDAENATRKAEQDKKDADARAEQTAKDAERQKELDALAANVAAAQKIMADERAVKEAIEQAKESREAQMARAPDRDKLLDYCVKIDTLIGSKPTMESQEGSNTMLFAIGELITIAKTVRECVEEMK
jgi:hypothetical protein